MQLKGKYVYVLKKYNINLSSKLLHFNLKMLHTCKFMDVIKKFVKQRKIEDQTSTSTMQSPSSNQVTTSGLPSTPLASKHTVMCDQPSTSSASKLAALSDHQATSSTSQQALMSDQPSSSTSHQPSTSGERSKAKCLAR